MLVQLLCVVLVIAEGAQGLFDLQAKRLIAQFKTVDPDQREILR